MEVSILLMPSLQGAKKKDDIKITTPTNKKRKLLNGRALASPTLSANTHTNANGPITMMPTATTTTTTTTNAIRPSFVDNVYVPVASSASVLTAVQRDSQMLMESARIRAQLEIEACYKETVFVMRMCGINISSGDEEFTAMNEAYSKEQYKCVHEMTKNQMQAHIAYAETNFALRNRSQYETATLRYTLHGDPPCLSASYLSKWLRGSWWPWERECVFGEACEGMTLGSKRSTKGIILTEFLLPDEEKNLLETKYTMSPIRPSYHRACLLCDRRATHERCAEMDKKNPAFNFYAGATVHEAHLETHVNGEPSERKQAYFALNGHPTIINTHQVRTGPGEYKIEVIIGTHDRGSEHTVGLCGSALSYAPLDYTFHKDNAGRTIIREDNLLFRECLSNVENTDFPMHPFRLGIDTPSALLRQTYAFAPAPTLAPETNSEEVYKAIFSEEFSETVAACKAGIIGPGQVWPHASAFPPHWLPPGWHEAQSHERAQIRCALVNESPYLTALAARVNVAYDLFSRTTERHSSSSNSTATENSTSTSTNTNTNTDTNTDVHADTSDSTLHHLRLFMNTHCQMALFITEYGIQNDESLHARCILIKDNPLWADMRPGPERLISPRNLPRTLLSLLPYLDWWHKRQMTTKMYNQFVHILRKALPQPGQRRVMFSIVRDKSDFDDRFLRIISYIVLCAMLGTYAHAARTPYSFTTQMTILHSMSSATRAALLGFIAKENEDVFIIYTLREFLVFAVAQMPALEASIYRYYNWRAFTRETIHDMRRVRHYLIEKQDTLHEKAAVDHVWLRINTYLEKRYKDHSEDIKTKKQRISSMVASVHACVREQKKRALKTMKRKKEKDQSYTSVNQDQVQNENENVNIFADMASISVEVWDRVCAYIVDVHPMRSYCIADLAELGMSRRGTQSARYLMNVYNNGALMHDVDFRVFTPRDFEIFHAFLLVHKHLHNVNVGTHPMSVVRAQIKAFRHRNHLLHFHSLRGNADRVYFCDRCLAFCHVIAKTHAATLATGPDLIIHELCRRTVLCGRKKKNVRCLNPVLSFRMLGKIVGIRRNYYSICCACTSLYLYDATLTVFGFPVCGNCDAEGIMRKAGLETFWGSDESCGTPQ